MQYIQTSSYFQAYRESLLDLVSQFSTRGVYLYNQRNQIKEFKLDDWTVVIKSYKKPHLLNAFIYHYLRASKCRRSFYFAQRLNSLDIPTPEPIAFIENSCNGLLCESYFIYKKCPYSQNLYHLRGESLDKSNRELLRALALFSADMHEKGVFHKDFSPGNILYQYNESGYQFSLIDINRMAFGAVSMKRACIGFRRLWGGDEMISYFAEQYANIRGFDPKECARMALLYNRRFMDKLEKKDAKKRK